jgi:hypothetical protein
VSDIVIRVENLGERYRIGGPSSALKARLKILSRITEPTEGYAGTCRERSRTIHGRVGSLLEACPEREPGVRSRRMGAGFHPDPSLSLRTRLTERENIYLNGAILRQ